MKMAIVCDDLIQRGGAEEVFLDIISQYPDAVVYTSFISKEWQKTLDELGVPYRVSFLQKLPFVSKLYRFYSILYFHVLAFESFDFTEFDLVLSLSSRYAHFIITKPSTKHVCYMHSPARMFWNTRDYFSNEFWRIFLFLIYPFLFFVRMSDYVAAQRVDLFIANSKVTQKRIRKHYNRDSVVLNPGVDTSKFKVSSKVEDYFLIVGRLSPWKRNDLVVQAANKLGLKLKVIGKGPDMFRLKILAKSNLNIEFLGYLPNEERNNYLSKCTALIYPQLEDFGIVPLESMASGRPVISYGKGGVLETVKAKETGVFFSEQTLESVESVLKTFDQNEFIPQNCITQAVAFDKKVFKSKLYKLLSNVYLENN